MAVTLHRHLHTVELIHQCGQDLDGAALAEVPEGVSSVSQCPDSVPVGAHGPGHDADQIGAVQRDELPHPAAVSFHDGPTALQVSQPLLTGVGHKEHARGGGEVSLHDIAGADHQHRQVGGVVRYARTVHHPVLLPEGHGLRIRENGVRVGHDDHHIALFRHVVGADHVQRLVDHRVLPAVPHEPVPAEGSPILLVVGRRRNGAQVPDQLLELLL